MNHLMETILFDWRDGIVVGSWFVFYIAMRILARKPENLDLVDSSVLHALWWFGTLNVIVYATILAIGLDQAKIVYKADESSPKMACFILIVYTGCLFYLFWSTNNLLNIKKKSLKRITMCLCIFPILMLIMAFFCEYIGNSEKASLSGAFFETSSWKIVSVFLWPWLVYFTFSQKIHATWQIVDRQTCLAGS